MTYFLCEQQKLKQYVSCDLFMNYQEGTCQFSEYLFENTSAVREIYMYFFVKFDASPMLQVILLRRGGGNYTQRIYGTQYAGYLIVIWTLNTEVYSCDFNLHLFAFH